jgi:hypothetical protein
MRRVSLTCHLNSEVKELTDRTGRKEREGVGSKKKKKEEEGGHGQFLFLGRRSFSCSDTSPSATSPSQRPFSSSQESEGRRERRKPCQYAPYSLLTSTESHAIPDCGVGSRPPPLLQEKTVTFFPLSLLS